MTIDDPGHGEPERVRPDDEVAAAPREYERAAFRRIRSLRRLFWFLWAAYIPVAGGTMIVLMRLGVPENAAVMVAVAWLGAFAVVGILHGLSKCPRCKESCFRRALWSNPWATRCMHCGVRLYWDEHDLER